MLLGARALVVEDEYLIALEIERILKDAGAGTAFIAQTVDDASRAMHQEAAGFELAVVSIGADSAASFGLCAELEHAGFAVVLVSNDGAHREGVAGFDGVPTVIKPFSDEEVTAAATAALTRTRSPDSVS